MKRYVTITAVVALLLHVTLGWIWSAAGAVLGAYLSPRRGILTGTLGVGIAWTSLLVFRIVQGPEQVMEMGRVVAGILGGLPSIATFLITVLIGMLLGAAGGAVGTYLADLLRTRD